jgi:hypothetical protein
MKGLIIAASILALASCGSRPLEVDESGLVVEESDLTAFARASQLYFRGNLSRARDGFNSVIYRFPGSILEEDATLAVRRIEQDLGTGPGVDSGSVTTRSVEIAVVGLPVNSPRISAVVSALQASGWSAWSVLDDGAPDITVVLYPDGLGSEAAITRDSLHSWLTAPGTIPVQPGGQMMDAIVPGHEGIVVVIGGDAAVSPRAPSAGSGGSS